jgi:putative lipoprotein
VKQGSWRWLAEVAVVTGLLATGCGDRGTEPAAVPVHGVGPTAVENSLKGLCVIGHEVRTFVPCGSEKVYWIEADEASLERLQTAVGEYTDEPYEPFFAEIIGRLTEEAGEGFAADYDGQVMVDTLVRVAPASELDCGG